MGLAGALGALLLDGPSHGYELHATLEAELGPSWVTRVSQVYLTLGRMSRDSLVTGERIHQAMRPDRQRLTLTPRGRLEAEAWLVAGPAAEIVVRLSVARLVAPDRFGEIIEAMNAERIGMLHRLRVRHQEALLGFQGEAVEAEMAGVEGELRWLMSVQAEMEAILARPRARRAFESMARLA